MNKSADKMKAIEQLCANDGAVLLTGSANMRYYSGFTGEGCVVITPSHGWVITDFRYVAQSKAQSPGFEVVTGPNDVAAVLQGMGINKLWFEDDVISYADYQKYAQYFSFAELIPHKGGLSEPRRVKSQEEIQCIAAAAAIADAGFAYIIERIEAGRTELEIAAELECFMKKQGAEGVSFETIVASGLRSAMPHGVASTKKLEKGDFVVMDFGCIVDGYCSDMTRTVVIGSASDRHKEIYHIVLDAQLKALACVKAGVACADADTIARDIIKAAGYAEQFGHSLGHSVGLDIHEVPALSPKSKDVLAAGMVVTVEPGIYIEDFGGVRIEDLVVVEDGNCRILSKTAKEMMII